MLDNHGVIMLIFKQVFSEEYCKGLFTDRFVYGDGYHVQAVSEMQI